MTEAEAVGAPVAHIVDGNVPVTLNLDTLIGSHLCIQANSGAGKSGAIRKVLEVTHGRVQHIVIDTEDEFYTLREKFDYLIAGGDNGDCAASVNNAAALAMTILETGFSAIVQINSLPFDQRCLFIGAFLTALTEAPKRLWRPVLVVLDEAQFYAPQKGYASSLDAIVTFMMLGRKRGFTGILATPRPADLSKAATSPVNNWMIGRCGQPADRRSAADALGFTANSAEARNLRSLVARQFWVFGPALTNEPVLAKIEKTETTIVKAGQATLPTPPAPAAMQKILASLNAAAVEKKDDPLPNSEPKSGVEIGSVEPDPKLIEEAETRGFNRGFEAGIARQMENVAGLRADVDAVFSGFLGFFHSDKGGTLTSGSAPAPAVDTIAVQKPQAMGTSESVLRFAGGIIEPDGEITPIMRETLHALAWWARLGHRQPTRKQLGALINVTPGGSTMRSRLAALIKTGLITYPSSDTIALTDTGAKAAPPVATGNSLIETIRAGLSNVERETFDAIPAAGRSISREALGKALGGIDAKGSTMRSRLANLTARELIYYPSSDTVARQDWVKG